METENTQGNRSALALGPADERIAAWLLPLRRRRMRKSSVIGVVLTLIIVNGTDLRLADKADLAWFACTFNVQYPQLIDPTYGVVNQYGISVYPGVYVIDKTGRVIFSSAGHHSYASLAAALGGGRSG